MRNSIAATLMIVLACTAHATYAITFEQFPVKEVFSGEHAPPPADASQKHKAALTRPVNFAGHYIVYFYPCGGGCITGSVIDAKTGKIVASLPGGTRLPGVYVVDTFEPQFSSASTLMIITGESAKTGGGATRRHYNFIDNHFYELK